VVYIGLLTKLTVKSISVILKISPRRLSEYFRNSYLIKTVSMPICNALIKYGHKNFRLEILEYCECEASQEKLLEREKYYIQLLPHTERYNIVEDPTLPPMSGRKHSDATKIIMSGHTHSNQTKKKKISDAMTGSNHSNETKSKISDTLKGHKGAAQPTSQAIEVLDKDNNQTTTYESIREAARALNIPSHKTITNYIKNNQKKPYKGRYTLKKKV